MGNSTVTRRLAAILAADVVGYSRLMGADEMGTLDALRDIWGDLFNPAMARHHGRIVKTMGDGALVEFGSVVDAVNAALEFQRAMKGRNSGKNEGPEIHFRIGVNLGDIVTEEGDVFGDGVNIAARLEAAAPSGGILISESVHQQVAGRIKAAFIDAGVQSLKNIARPVRCWQWEEDSLESAESASPTAETVPASQKIHFCTSFDGVEIAYATAGSGPPLVRAPHWMSHLEYDWQTPIWRHTMQELSRKNTFIRFDQRGNGLSDWEVEDISFEAFVQDLAAVVDHAGLERFPLLGISQGCAISIAYAIRNPGRVSHLILYGGFARGRDKRGTTSVEEAQARRTLIKIGWGQDNPAFRQMFTSTFLPGGTQEQWNWFNELERISVSPENARRIAASNDVIDVNDLLGEINIPTLVMHCRNDGVTPFSEGRRLAAMIPNARFVALEGSNHLILEDEPAWPIFIKEMRDFLKNN